MNPLKKEAISGKMPFSHFGFFQCSHLWDVKLGGNNRGSDYCILVICFKQLSI
jgi:hypothetical protein